MARSAIVTINASSPKTATSISINVSPTSGYVPFDIAVTGKLIDSAGNPLIGKSVVLYMNGVYVDTRTTTVSPPGEYGFSVVISDAGTYQCQVVFGGDDVYAGCNSAIITVNAYAPRIKTSLSINVNPTSGTIPFTVSVSGKLVDSAGVGLLNKTINVYSNGVLVTSGPTGAPDGSYLFYIDITVAGTYQFQTEFPGDATYEGCIEHNGALGIEVPPPPDWGKVLLVGGLLAFVYFAVKK
jgi:hypothetical protein